MLRILIAHDGSACSDKVLQDLRKAGLPEKADALVLSVADDWAVQEGIVDNPEIYMQYAVPYSSLNFTDLTVKEAKTASKKAAEAVKQFFPSWNVRHEAVNSDSAAEGVIGKIRLWNPDFAAMGSHGRSAAGRLLFGSVTQKVLSRVHCNLRISRGHGEEGQGIAPLRIVVAFDGSQESETAFQMALCRHWPQGTAIRILTVADMRVSTAFIEPSGPIAYWARKNDTSPVAWVDRMFADQKKHLQEKGLIASAEILKGDPKRSLLKAAEEWGADTIFVGPRGLTAREKIIAGSVSTALAVHAHCSVEIVHRLWDATACCGKVHEQHRECMSHAAR